MGRDSLGLLRELVRKTKLKPSLLLLPAVLAVSAALFEAASMFLLVPIVHGSVRMDFAFIKTYPILKAAYARWPQDMPTTNPSVFATLAGLIFLMSLLRILFSFTSILEFARLVRHFADRLRQLIFGRCLGFGKLYFDRTPAGQVQHILAISTEEVASQLLSLQDMVANLIMLAAYLPLMFWISWKLTLGVMLVFPLTQSMMRTLVIRIKKASGERVHARKALSNLSLDVLSNLSLVKASASEELEKTRFQALSREASRLDSSMDTKSALVRPVQDIVFLAIVLAVLFALAFIAGRQRSGLAPGLLVYVYLLRRASLCIMALGKLGSSLAAIHGPLLDVLHLFDDSDKAVVPDGDRECPVLNDRIEFRELRFAFPDGRRIFDGASFCAKKGQTTAIVGPSGTGKTTLINLLMRLYDPPAGSILLDGMDIRAFSMKSWRAKLALISQDTPLFHDTIRRNVAYPAEDAVPDSRIMEALSAARLSDLIYRLPHGLNTPIGDRGIKLSGGEKQRLSIARAILQQAEIILLDEATSSLDSQTETLIQESIAALVRDRTALVIAHRLSTIKHADKVVVIENGRVAEDGSVHVLLGNKGLFFRYWESQRFD